MNSASVELSVKNPVIVKRAVTPAFTSSDSNVEADNEALKIQVSANSSGSLRGRVDAAFRLSLISNRILKR